MVEMNKQIEIACDNHEAEQFRDSAISGSPGYAVPGLRANSRIPRPIRQRTPFGDPLPGPGRERPSDNPSNKR